MVGLNGDEEYQAGIIIEQFKRSVRRIVVTHFLGSAELVLYALRNLCSILSGNCRVVERACVLFHTPAARIFWGKDPRPSQKKEEFSDHMRLRRNMKTRGKFPKVWNGGGDWKPAREPPHDSASPSCFDDLPRQPSRTSLSLPLQMLRFWPNRPSLSRLLSRFSYVISGT